jgi:hypothetical protein
MPEALHQQFIRDRGDNQMILDKIASGDRYYRDGTDITAEVAVDARCRRDLAVGIVSAYTPS